MLAAVVFTVAAPSLADGGSQDTADFLPKNAPSQQANQVLAKLFNGDPTRDTSVMALSRSGDLIPAVHT